MKIAHIINVFEIHEKHKANYLHIAQPVTIQSMIDARNNSNEGLGVDLYAVTDRNETVDMPDEFTMTKDLQRCCYDVIDTLPKTKSFPLIGDILESLYHASDADYFIYTNTDIGLFPNFYDFVEEKINEGFDALCINRRDMPKKVTGEIIDEHNFQKVFDLKGIFHPGKDCFVFKRSLVSRMKLGNVFLGAPPVGGFLLDNIKRNATNFTLINGTSIAVPRLVTFHLGRDRDWKRRKNEYWVENRRQAKLCGFG